MKKIIIAITIISFVNLIGCYNQKQLSSDNYIFNPGDNVTVVTQDTVYNLNGDKCLLKNDTLFYKVAVPIDQKSMKIKTMMMPIEQTDKIEIESIDGLKTTLLVLGVLVITIVAIGATTFDFSDAK